MNENKYLYFMVKNFVGYKNIIEENKKNKFNWIASFLTPIWLPYRNSYFSLIIAIVYKPIYPAIIKLLFYYKLNIIIIIIICINLMIFGFFLSFYFGFKGNKIYIKNFLKYCKKTIKYKNKEITKKLILLDSIVRYLIVIISLIFLGGLRYFIINYFLK